MSSIRSRFDRASTWFAPSRIGPGDAGIETEVGAAAVDTALRLSAITLLLRPMGTWFTLPAILGIASVALVSTRLLRAPITWLALAGLVATRIAADWPLADNHIYLLAYWCLAVACALLTADVAGTLAASARWLIVLSFALAVVWKTLLSPDYLDGRFFRVTLMTDPRLTEVTMLVGGLSPGQLERNRAVMEAPPEGAALLDPPAVTEPWRLRTFANLATWGVLTLEAAVVAAFLLSGASQPRWLPHALLLGFCVVTYAVAPVPGFGCLLAVLGLVQCRDRRLCALYVAVFVLVVAYAEVPWAGLIIDWIGAG